MYTRLTEAAGGWAPRNRRAQGHQRGGPRPASPAAPASSRHPGPCWQLPSARRPRAGPTIALPTPGPPWHAGLQGPSERGDAGAGERSAGTPRPTCRPPPPRARRAVADLPAGARDIARACGGARPPTRPRLARRHLGLGDPLASGARQASRHNRVPHRPAWPRTPPSPSGGGPQAQRQVPWSGPATAVALLGPPPRPPHARPAPTRAQGQSLGAAASQYAGRRRSGHLTHRPVHGSRELRRLHNAGRSMVAAGGGVA